MSASSPNGVVLTRHVPAAALVELRPMTRRARARADALRQVMGL